MEPEITMKGMLKIVRSAGLGTANLERRLERSKRANLAWLRLCMAVDGLDQGEAERALRDMFFALGASVCDEQENGDGSATLVFSGLGRNPGRRLRIKMEVIHG